MAQDIPQTWIDKVKELASGEVFTAEEQGKWQGKAGSHVPLASKNDDGTITVKVGSCRHYRLMVACLLDYSIMYTVFSFSLYCLGASWHEKGRCCKFCCNLELPSVGVILCGCCPREHIVMSVLVG
jgi:hypothetical protein